MNKIFYGHKYFILILQEFGKEQKEKIKVII